jgi:nicotinamidase-related amidase
LLPRPARGRFDFVADPALLVVDVQRAFDDAEYWGRRNNPACEENIAALVDAWRARDLPVVFVRHDSTEVGSPLAPGEPGNAFKDVLTGEPDLLVTKSVHSSFHGAPDLDSWLRGNACSTIVVSGIATDWCCETTARLGCDLGYDVVFRSTRLTPSIARPRRGTRFPRMKSPALPLPRSTGNSSA